MEIREIVKKQREFFLNEGTKDPEKRKKVLRTIYHLLKDNEDQLNEAIYQDLGKSAFETYATELALVYGEINLHLKKLNNWVKKRRVRTNMANFPGSSYIVTEPYGNCLIIGAWNYPYQLTLSPLIPCIAAGNTAILKPSELSPNTSAIMARLINQEFPSELIYVYEGGVEETSRLLELKFDKIFFTGSTRVGKIVMQAAAKNLTPVTLELGGKSPCFVFEDADVKVSAKRIAWGKFLNAGQTCVAPDYLLVKPEIKEKLLSQIVFEIGKIQGNDPSNSEAYLRIVNEKHFERLNKLINKEKIFYGGIADKEKLYISPTILHNVDFQHPVMEEEIFGPILPVIEFNDLKEIIAVLKQLPKPLSLYIFTRNKFYQKEILSQVSFGGGCINDTVLHLTNPNLPFGGVGESGIGSYHGKAGFLEFSHQKSILKKPYWFEPFMKYPPYNNLKKKLLRFFIE